MKIANWLMEGRLAIIGAKVPTHQKPRSIVDVIVGADDLV